MNWLRSLPSRFPFGLAPFLILLMTLVAGVWLALHPVPRNPATLVLWSFAYIHTNAYGPAVHPLKPDGTPWPKPAAPGATFEEKHPGVTVDVQLVHNSAINNRLRAAFQAGLDVPDLVEVEISHAGTFFRGPQEDVGFRDLTPYLKEAGFLDPQHFVTARLAPYTHRGKIYGLAHDVHPVMLGYRRDLFAELGLDPKELTTWDKFIAAGRRITVKGKRYLIMLPEAEDWGVQTVLYQRGGGYFDADGQLIMDNELAVDTLKWYVRLVAGENRIAGDPGFWTSAYYQALQEGYVLSFICPDWRCSMTETNAKAMEKIAGNLALMPLPAFEPGGRRTSTWGGTMLGITRKCRDPDLAWKLARYLYSDKETLAAIFRETKIIPPLKDAWDHPVYDESFPFWSGQQVGRLYMELAPQVPRLYPSPFLPIAVSKLTDALSACIAYYNGHGEAGFDEFARRRLKQDADDVRKQMARNPF